ncbi:MAG: PH domain-containing protein [Nocardioidaceae bacterium]
MSVPEGEFHRLHPLSPILRGGLFLVVWLGWVARNLSDGFDAIEFAWTGLATLAAGLVFGLGSWWFTSYRVSASELRVDTGVLVRRSRRIRIDRLQAVDVRQPLLARLVGLAELSFDVGGGNDSDAKLAYLPLEQAVRLRDQLLGSAGATEAAQPSRTLLAVSSGRLAGSLLLRNEFVGALVSAAFGVVLTMVSGTPVGVVVVLGSVAGVGSLLAREFVLWSRFTVTESRLGLRIATGLLGRRSQTVPVDRVQGVVVAEPLLWRALGWARLDITVAGVGGDDEERKQQLSTLVPVAPRASVDALLDSLLGADHQSVALTAPPARSRWVDPIGRRFAAAGYDEQLVVSRRGVLVRRTDVVPRGKIQSVRVQRGPLQRVLGLASVHVDLPRGPVHAVVAHRATDEAWQLALDLVRKAAPVRRAGHTTAR